MKKVSELTEITKKIKIKVQTINIRISATYFSRVGPNLTLITKLKFLISIKQYDFVVFHFKNRVILIPLVRFDFGTILVLGRNPKIN